MGGGADAGFSGASTALDEEAVVQRSEFWWPLLMLAALVLGAESVLANRWTRRRPTSALAQSV